MSSDIKELSVSRRVPDLYFSFLHNDLVALRVGHVCRFVRHYFGCQCLCLCYSNLYILPALDDYGCVLSLDLRSDTVTLAAMYIVSIVHFSSVVFFFLFVQLS